ncbi:MAG: AFG1 family ATPase [Alphaproteobacteria bacterium]|nr:AFG1 family ATPase [Alphaproteobacteria bacterium]
MGADVTNHPVRAAYRSLIADGVLSPDPAQDAANVLLAGIAAELEANNRSGNPLARLVSRSRSVRGAYVWGEVGRGKTMLMDVLVENIAIARKRRVHFHEFMDEVHSAIADFRRRTADVKGRRDPIPAIVKGIVAETRLLCLDEFHVADITNAMLLGRLFEALFEGGVTLVATSNTRPDDLYLNGLNRQLVLPFIDLLKQRTAVMQLQAAADYRHLKLAGRTVFAFGPPDETTRHMDAIWSHLTGGQPGHVGAVRVLGRDIAVPRQAMGVARFPFAALCDAPLGSRDYLRLAETFHTFVIDAVPVFGRANANAAQRFILLVDTLYDRGVRLAAGFAAPLDDLSSDERISFSFARCRSRLAEMQSADYLAAPLGAGD